MRKDEEKKTRHGEIQYLDDIKLNVRRSLVRIARSMQPSHADATTNLQVDRRALERCQKPFQRAANWQSKWTAVLVLMTMTLRQGVSAVALPFYAGAARFSCDGRGWNYVELEE